MERRFRVLPEHTRASEASHRRAQLADDAGLAQAAGEELLLMGLARVNLILAGRDTLIGPLLKTLLRNAQKPIVSWYPGETFALPSTEAVGTLVLHELGSLVLREQIQLLEWSGRALGNTQVISTTSASLVPRIRAGAFIDTLYYRLNTVYLDVTEMDEAQASSDEIQQRSVDSR